MLAVLPYSKVGSSNPASGQISLNLKFSLCQCISFIQNTLSLCQCKIADNYLRGIQCPTRITLCHWLPFLRMSGGAVGMWAGY